MKKSHEKTRLRWRCRRGMLELDLILNRFLDEQYDDLPEPQRAAFESLLTCIDPEIFSWLMEHQTPPDQELCEIVTLIKNHHQPRKIG